MNDYPALQNFLSAYFHQDWAMEHDTPQAVVDGYRSGEAPDQLKATREDLARLLVVEPDDAALGEEARRLGSEYDPTRDGSTWRGWLESVQAALSRG